MTWLNHNPRRVAAGFAGTAARWLRRRRTSAELLALDDATLKDIGLHRSEIHSIVWGTPHDRSRRLR